MNDAANIKALSKRLGEPAWLRDQRLAAWSRFAAAPRPSFRYGLGLGTDAAGILLPYEASKGRGQKPPAFSAPAGAVVGPWRQALADRRMAAGLRRLLTRPGMPADKIADWLSARMPDAVVVYVPRNVRCERPVQIDLDLRDARRLDGLYVIAESGSAVTVIEHIFGTPAGRASRASAVGVWAGPGAKVTQISVQDLGPRVCDFTRRTGLAEAGARIDWLECCLGSAFAFADTATVLAGPRAETGHSLVFVGRGQQRFDLRQSAEHAAPRTVSRLDAKGVLLDSASAVYRGLIDIGRGRLGCDGRQKEDTLLLGDNASISALPAIKTGTDDVRCGHAASSGRLDEERLFYLMSRGLDPQAATRLAVEAFLAPLIAAMKGSGLEETVSCLIAKRFAGAPGNCAR